MTTNMSVSAKYCSDFPGFADGFRVIAFYLRWMQIERSANRTSLCTCETLAFIQGVAPTIVINVSRKICRYLRSYLMLVNQPGFGNNKHFYRLFYNRSLLTCAYGNQMDMKNVNRMTPPQVCKRERLSTPQSFDFRQRDHNICAFLNT